MVQFGVIVAVIEPRRRASHVAADPVIVMYASDCENPDVVVDEAPDRRGVLDGRAIRRHVRRAPRVGVAGDAESADPRRSGTFEGLQVGSGEPQRWMRALDWPRNHLACRQIEMRALVAGEIFLLEHLHHGLQRLAPDFAAVLGIGVEAEPFHYVGSGATSRAE